ncbi:MAG: hypothetical protein J5J04_17190 [Anaerolineae bacterium]|nr:hypothetical protein [Chloroflexota bacterium]MBV6436968.1 hypothetical protein [Anaerolineae bacterium]MDL1916684.1 hypothetical protein [Anaerolineae bacterium CFX4]OQY83541.1 MAG: hypothetical protein B6D42_07275 [Anaerolineae bacterium UTCFX5]MCO6445809.1 hypothetical protein [Anaerolineae bacterium]
MSIDPSVFESTQDEILQAVRENSIRRGLFFLRSLTSMSVDNIITAIEKVSSNFDMEQWRIAADSEGIEQSALDILDAHVPRIPYPYYFCLSADIVKDPTLILYYRNVAMVSNKVMNNIGLTTVEHESGSPISHDKALRIAQHLNRTVSGLVSESNLHGPRRHLELMYSNIGASLDGSWRNEVGRLAYSSIVTPVIAHLHHVGKLQGFEYKLKGNLLLGGDEDADSSETIFEVAEGLDEQELSTLLLRLEEERVVYRAVNLKNGNQVLLNRQITWYSADKKFKIGPDLLTQTTSSSIPWVAELKGGADPAGSDEHWKTATQSFNRIREAADATGRPQPMLTFIATILVTRVAQEIALAIDRGELTSVYNLTKIENDPRLQGEFLDDLVKYFETP